MGKLGWFMSDINRNIPIAWRWAHGDPLMQVLWSHLLRTQSYQASCSATSGSHVLLSYWNLTCRQQERATLGQTLKSIYSRNFFHVWSYTQVRVTNKSNNQYWTHLNTHISLSYDCPKDFLRQTRQDVFMGDWARINPQMVRFAVMIHRKRLFWGPFVLSGLLTLKSATVALDNEQGDLCHCVDPHGKQR